MKIDTLKKHNVRIYISNKEDYNNFGDIFFENDVNYITRIHINFFEYSFGWEFNRYYDLVDFINKF